MASKFISQIVGRDIKYLYHFTKTITISPPSQASFSRYYPASKKNLPIHFSMSHQAYKIYMEKFTSIPVTMFRIPVDILDPEYIEFVKNREMNNELFVRYRKQIVFGDFPRMRLEPGRFEDLCYILERKIYK
jgi:hypothetical protein